jgi:hypothetical protein
MELGLLSSSGNERLKASINSSRWVLACVGRDEDRVDLEDEMSKEKPSRWAPENDVSRYCENHEKFNINLLHNT